MQRRYRRHSYRIRSCFCHCHGGRDIACFGELGLESPYLGRATNVAIDRAKTQHRLPNHVLLVIEFHQDLAAVVLPSASWSWKGEFQVVQQVVYRGNGLRRTLLRYVYIYQRLPVLVSLSDYLTICDVESN